MLILRHKPSGLTVIQDGQIERLIAVQPAHDL
jgi:hypothetical protein